jgi:hypothetical protein
MIHSLYVVICPHNHNPANFIRHVVEIIIDFGLSTRKKMVFLCRYHGKPNDGDTAPNSDHRFN